MEPEFQLVLVLASEPSEGVRNDHSQRVSRVRQRVFRVGRRSRNGGPARILSRHGQALDLGRLPPRERVLSGSRRAITFREARAVRSPQRAQYISIVEIAAVAVALVGFGVALYLLRGTFL
jgi:hypothetical protein